MSSEKKILKPVSFTVGTLFAASMAASNVASADTSGNPFAVTELNSGYMQVAAEGRCGGQPKAEKEGQCGGAKSEKEGKCGEGKCGGAKKSEKEGQCGGAKKSEKEGKCGEGKCGSM